MFPVTLDELIPADHLWQNFLRCDRAASDQPTVPEPSFPERARTLVYLQADPRASLLVTQPDASGDPLGASRVTVMGNVQAIPEPEVVFPFGSVMPYGARMFSDGQGRNWCSLLPV
jgi:hypothetical protein